MGQLKRVVLKIVDLDLEVDEFLVKHQEFISTSTKLGKKIQSDIKKNQLVHSKLVTDLTDAIINHILAEEFNSVPSWGSNSFYAITEEILGTIRQDELRLKRIQGLLEQSTLYVVDGDQLVTIDGSEVIYKGKVGGPVTPTKDDYVRFFNPLISLFRRLLISYFPENRWSTVEYSRSGVSKGVIVYGEDLRVVIFERQFPNTTKWDEYVAPDKQFII